MRIENELKLDFKDVLIRPKRSTLSSRKEVDLNRTHKFLHSNTEWTGVPIIAANMDTIGTLDMTVGLWKHNAMTALHKFHKNDDLAHFYISNFAYKNVWYTIGANQNDLNKFINFRCMLEKQVNELSKDPNIEIDPQILKDPLKVCIDVANGYQESFVDFVKSFRDGFPNTVIMAGNVVTGEMTEELLLSGASVVKCGIGPGCFVPGTLVNTKDGLKPIEKIAEGDVVLTHKQNWQNVSKIFKYYAPKEVVNVNGIRSTKHHEYYVVHKTYKDIINDDNIHEYAEWIPAEKLTKEYLLLKHKM